MPLHLPTFEGLEWLTVSAAISVPSAAISRYVLEARGGRAVGDTQRRDKTDKPNGQQTHRRRGKGKRGGAEGVEGGQH